jgi:hypothetical protein
MRFNKVSDYVVPDELRRMLRWPKIKKAPMAMTS